MCLSLSKIPLARIPCMMYNNGCCMESYQSGRNEPHSKCGCRVSGTWVRIPPTPFLLHHSESADADAPALFLFNKVDQFGSRLLHSPAILPRNSSRWIGFRNLPLIPESSSLRMSSSSEVVVMA